MGIRRTRASWSAREAELPCRALVLRGGTGACPEASRSTVRASTLPAFQSLSPSLANEIGKKAGAARVAPRPSPAPARVSPSLYPTIAIVTTSSADLSGPGASVRGKWERANQQRGLLLGPAVMQGTGDLDSGTQWAKEGRHAHRLRGAQSEAQSTKGGRRRPGARCDVDAVCFTSGGHFAKRSHSLTGI